MNGIYDYFSPARHYQSYHGGLRIADGIGQRARRDADDDPVRDALQQQGRGYNAQQRSWNFLEPWPGGRWTLRDIVE
jgi:hypothetical protein